MKHVGNLRVISYIYFTEMCPGSPGNYAQFSNRHSGPKRSNSLTGGQAPRTPDSPLAASSHRRHSDSETQSCHSLPYSLGDSRESLKLADSIKNIAACSASANMVKGMSNTTSTAGPNPVGVPVVTPSSINTGRIQVKETSKTARCDLPIGFLLLSSKLYSSHVVVIYIWMCPHFVFVILVRTL